MGLSVLWAHLKGMKHYLIAATLVFLTGFFLGYAYSGPFQAFLDNQLAQLGDIAKKVMQSENKSLTAFIYIFLNNTLLAALMVYLGGLFALIPIYFLITNGLLLGYLANQSAHSDKMMVFVKGIGPHGIIEIPVIIIACAYGIRFGFLVLDGIRSLPNPERRRRLRIKMKAFLKVTVPLVLSAGILLLLAAGIESTLTLWLVSK